MKTDNLIPAAPLDRRELAPGVQLCFTRLDAPLCPPPLDWPRLLVFDFCRSGRRAIPDGAQYAIVTEGHAAVSFAVPGADFYLPGSQYEALQLFIDPDAVQADSYEALAEKLGIDPATFAATMETWNKAVADQKDDAFGRLSFASALDTAPYYAIKVSPGIHHTMGGVKINTNAEVLTAEDQVIPGLYAAGEVTGGVHGANRLGGNAVADIVIFGRIAAQNAAAYIAK